MEFTNLITVGIILSLSIIGIWNRSFSLNILIVLLEIISIPIGKSYQNQIEKSFFDNKGIKEILREMQPDIVFSSIQNSRNELRFGLKIITSITVLLSLYLTILSKSIWGFFTSVAVIWIAFVFADYIPHASFYSKYYDSLFTGKIKKAKSIRGLARIYKNEYEITNGFKDKEFYKSINDYQASSDCNEQDECIKCILYMKADSLYYPIILYSIIILFFNIILVIPHAFEISIKTLLSDLRINYDLLLSIVVLVFNVMFALLNLWMIIHHYKSCKLIQRIYNSFNSDKSVDRINEYNRLRKEDGKSFEIIRSRGVFVFCSTIIDKHINLDTINMKYRMLYSHRYYTNKPRFWITFWFTLIILGSVIMTWNISWDIGLMLLSSFIVVSLLFYFLWLPRLGKWRIINNINNLE